MQLKFLKFIPLLFFLLLAFPPKTNAQVISELKWKMDIDSWPYAPQMGDLDRNGTPEIIFSTDKFIYIISGTGNLIRKIPIKYTDNPPVLVNMDNDKDLEIVGADGDSVSAWNIDGSLVAGWPKSTGKEYVSAVMAGDIDKDGILDIIGVGYSINGTSSVFVWDKNGQLKTGWPRNFNFWPGIPALADLNKDGKKEIILPLKALSNQSRNGKLFVLNSDGTTVSGWPKTYERDFNVVSVADLDKNGKLEVIAGTGYALDFGGNKIFAYNADGTSRNWNATTEFNLNELSIGDMNDNGKLETAIDDAGGGGGNANLLNYLGNNVSGWPIVISPSLDALQAPILVDINNDGKADYISPLTSGKIFAAKYNGTKIPLNIDISPLMALHVLINDFDNDGKNEMFVAGTKDSSSKVFMYDLNSNYFPASMQWKSERHDLKNTGRYTSIPQTATYSQILDDLLE